MKKKILRQAQDDDLGYVILSKAKDLCAYLKDPALRSG
jgi:hypothetical protein